MKRTYILILTVSIITISCCRYEKFDHLNLPASMELAINSNMQFDKYLVYYHTGECSFCYAILMNLSNEFSSLPVISISSSDNKKLVDYYLEQIHFRGISLFDTDSLFLNSNKALLETNNLFLLNSDGFILVNGKDLDEQIIKQIWKAINTL